ncbi:MAG TPA: hypothetical protein PLX89_04220 [Verrucomicrobiota bacterium]|nr:hypothetical protein [Verrucomicrobiales bacterium]HRI12190.1 hypothetical protein [Verrucomicrobiota bacterium]
MIHRFFCLSPSLVLLLLLGFSVQAAETNGWDKSLVTIEVTFKDYDYFQPWNKPTRSIRKHGLVVGDREVLTTAQSLPSQTLVRLQKGGRGKWYTGKVTWMDPHVDLALVTTDDAAFWDGLKPVEFAEVVPSGPDFNLLRWRDGNLESRRVEFSKFSVGESALSFAPRLNLEVNTELAGLGWAEAVTFDGKVVGLTESKSGNTCTVIPASLIRRVLAAHRAGNYRGLGYFDFTWQSGENPATLEFLKLSGPPRGAVVIEVQNRPGVPSVLKPRDILLEVDGFPVDVEGDYVDPDYGHLILENLATRSRFAGDTVPLKIWRDGQEMTINYTLPAANYADELVPRQAFGHDPDYVVAGGLVFQPLDQPFLRAWGDDWKRRSPFRLQFYQSEHPSTNRPSLVMLSTVLPDPINLGYQDARFLVLDQVNGRRISTLTDLTAALKEPKEGLHRFEFMRGDSLQRILLDAPSLDEATRRVLERYGIPASEHLTGPSGSGKS